MGRHGPPAPDPNWDRLDHRGPLSTRWAWGWLSPDGDVVVSDGGDVYVRVDREDITKAGRGSLSLGVTGSLVSALRRALRWSKIVGELYDEPEDEPEDEPRNLVLLPPRRRE